MNVASLIKQHPLLTADLRNLGLTNRKLHLVANDITAQLSGNMQVNMQGHERGSSNFNLCYIFNRLSCREFVQAVDANKIAQEAEVSHALAQTIVATIAPWVDKFQLRVTR